MANYDKAIAFTLKYEGGYVNDPADRGGETYRGITRINHPTWSGWAEVDRIKPRHGQIIPSLEDDVKKFYQQKYWGRIGEICNDALAAFIFDWRVNSGNIAIKKLQALVGADADGIIGSETISKANNYNGNLTALLIKERRKFVANIVKNNPSQNKFLNGWLNRIAAFETTFLV